ncbi:MAG: beta-ketoacyl-ACP synthase [Hyphomicrobiales bacterium]|nr:beta-ketoacyl-ACP synthase [Hyphomicrobiales bacterium]
MPAGHPRDAVITGIGLVTALADGIEAHHRLLSAAERPRPLTDAERFAPYPVHPLVEIDLSPQIPKRGDIRQMEDWQRYGTYAAGLALDDAGLAGNEAVLSEAGLIVAAGGGERDPEVDAAILEGLAGAKDPGAFINERLMNDLRPTLFLAQLSNLLAGNISIVHKVIGSSRTFMGEELCGAMALDIAARQIRADQGDVFLVGGSYNAPRPDMLLYLALGGYLWTGPTVPPLWQRGGQEGGIVCGSMGAFLVLEARAHAAARGARVYARLDEVIAGRGRRDDAQAFEAYALELAARLGAALGDEPAGLLSGASGARRALETERRMIEKLAAERPLPVRGLATMIGHGLEAQMPASVALAAIALKNKLFYRPFDDDGFEQAANAAPASIAVTGWGHWNGEAVAVLRAED